MYKYMNIADGHEEIYGPEYIDCLKDLIKYIKLIRKLVYIYKHYTFSKIYL